MQLAGGATVIKSEVRERHHLLSCSIQLNVDIIDRRRDVVVGGSENRSQASRPQSTKPKREEWRAFSKTFIVDLQLRSSEELSGPSLLGLEGDELLDCASNAAALLVGEVTEEADQVNIGGGESCNVIPLVVGVGAREGLASGEWGLKVLWGDDLDTVVVLWVYDGGDIKVGVTLVALEANLSKHAWDVLLSSGYRVPVADPLLRELDISSSVRLDSDSLNGRKRSLRSEDDGALSSILVDEVNAVGSNK